MVAQNPSFCSVFSKGQWSRREMIGQRRAVLSFQSWQTVLGNIWKESDGVRFFKKRNLFHASSLEKDTLKSRKTMTFRWIHYYDGFLLGEMLRGKLTNSMGIYRNTSSNWLCCLRQDTQPPRLIFLIAKWMVNFLLNIPQTHFYLWSTKILWKWVLLPSEITNHTLRAFPLESRIDCVFPLESGIGDV